MRARTARTANWPDALVGSCGRRGAFGAGMFIETKREVLGHTYFGTLPRPVVAQEEVEGSPDPAREFGAQPSEATTRGLRSMRGNRRGAKLGALTR